MEENCPISKRPWNYRARVPRNANFSFARLQGWWKGGGFGVFQELSDARGVLGPQIEQACQWTYGLINTALCSLPCKSIHWFLHEDIFEGRRGGAN
jgi:hypothetical protein